MSDGLNRIFGVETEFGCLVDSDEGISYEAVVEAVKDHVFHEQRLGVLDLNPRDEAFEPAFSGGFLINGGRLYVDAVGSHEEYATPECRSIFDLVAADRAGQRIITRAVKEMGLSDVVNFYNNSVDHFGGQTFGCHENYMVRAEDKFLNESVLDLCPFLVTRQIFAGSGRVGGHILDFGGRKTNIQDLTQNPIDYIWVTNVYGVEPDPTVQFQLSQRADHIIKIIASRVRFNRALINPKWESFYAFGTTSRLHMLFGEPNQMEFAYALKIGTTSLMLDLIEQNVLPPTFRLADPLADLKSVSRDESYRWIVTLETGETISAIDLHREYLKLAEDLRGRDKETDWVLDNWSATLDQLAIDPMQLSDKLDWVAKKKIIEQYIEATGCQWGDDALFSVDLEYHNIDPEKSLFQPLQDMGQAYRVVDELKIVDAMTEPPSNTRAFARAHLVRDLIKSRSSTYWVDWDAVYLDRQTVIELNDPFDNYARFVPNSEK